MSLFPHGTAWSNLRDAWSHVHVGRYFWNTIVLAIGSWLSQLLVATTAGFALSVLRSLEEIAVRRGATTMREKTPEVIAGE